jgi:hypothetical protein
VPGRAGGLRRIGGLLLALVTVVSLAGCGNGPDTGVVVQPHAGNDGLPSTSDNGHAKTHPEGFFSFQPDFLPISISISTDGQFSVDLSDSIVTPLGTITYGGGVARSTNGTTSKVLPPQAYDVTQLIVCLDGSDRHTCEGYQIGSGRKLNIAMNGQFQQTVERNRITIDAAPGSTITVTDTGPPATPGLHPAALIDIEEFDFQAQGKDTLVDLERGTKGSATDLGYDHMTGQLSLLNGARVGDITKYAGKHHTFYGNSLPKLDLPGENDCAQIKPSGWENQFTTADLKADVILACIETAEGDFGYMVIGRNRSAKPVAYYIYTYTWVR